jgi:TetR/AcrR family transcriptional regulator, cholesterol catabolism regulator
MSTIEPSSIPVGPSKEAVLEAAHYLIQQHGLSGFSMRDLAQQSGLAKATIYHHFQDKREIFFQVLERDLTMIRDHIVAAAATPGDLPTRLRTIIQAFFAISTKHGTLLISTLREAMSMEDELCHLIRRFRAELYRPITDLLAEGVKDGIIRPVDLELTAMSFFGILQAFTGAYLVTTDVQLDDKTIDHIIDLILHGLLISPSAERS